VQIICHHCSCSFVIEENSLTTLAQLTCPQCGERISREKGPINVAPPGPSIMKTARMRAITPDEFGELMLPASKKISLTLFEAGSSASQRLMIIKPRTIIGRKIGDILIDNPSLSPQHAALEIYDETYVIRDLQSKGGTFVNKTRITNQQLHSTDEIRLGKCRMLFLVTDLDYLEQEMNADVTNSQTASEESSQAGAKRSMTETDKSRRLVVVSDMEPVPGDPLLQQESHDIKATIVTSAVKQSAAKSRVGVELRFLTGKRAPQIMIINKSIIVFGRGNQADVTLDDQEVSRKHAVIELISPQTAYLKDLSSANGTFLNGDNISTSRLFSGDIVRIGTTEFEIHFRTS